MTDRDQWAYQLQKYATRVDPTTLGKDKLFSFTDTTITVFDAFPKSHYHLLILPRPRKPFEVEDMEDLRTMLRKNKEAAKEVLIDLGEAAKDAKAKIEAEMLDRWRFKWDVWIGFHAVPSMKHLHLHVISADLSHNYMKKKKHYNSFHPKLGFFLHFDDVMSWFEAEPSFWKQKSALKVKEYEDILKEPLQCFRCREEFRYMPQLKEHLKGEFDKIKTRERAKLEKKREFLEKMAKRKQEKEAREAAAVEAIEQDEDGPPQRKRARLEENPSEENDKASTS